MTKLRCRGAGLAIVALLLGACATQRFVDVRSANQDDRVRFLVLHFTDENFERSLDLLTRPHDNPVSAHYLVSRAGEGGHAAPTVYRLVDESQRAWHAGPSRWQGHEPLNGESVGVEIVDESHCPRDRSPSAAKAMDGRERPREPARPARASPWDVDATCAYPEWPADQIDAVIALARGIVARHPEIEATRVVGHSDVQPENKTDPGPRFPWRRLAEAGIGAWYDEADVAWYRGEFARGANGARGDGAVVLPLKTVQQALAAYGYGVAPSGVDDLRTHEVLSAFQSHFLPQRRSGEADAETLATLFALLARYRGDELRALREHAPEIPPSPPPRPR
jgi:N-acetylmuramoyl-L-alanine amidase